MLKCYMHEEHYNAFLKFENDNPVKGMKKEKLPKVAENKIQTSCNEISNVFIHFYNNVNVFINRKLLQNR